MRKRGALLSLVLLAQVSISCSRPPGLFSEPNARAHISMLAGTIGSRPVGTPNNARARDYIIDQLRTFGYEVRVQETDARRGSIGRTVRVSNIIATLAGKRPEAVGLLSHYDSVSAGPGAADDGLGVGVSLEAARVMASRADRNWTVMILVTDGEEANLMGAAALVTDRDVMKQLQAYINLEAVGSAGSPMLFEAGPGNGWLLTRWTRHAPQPRGASFVTEIYRRLPNDTDFSILRRQDVPGLNIAAVADSYAYHTPRDTPERLSVRTVRETGEQVVALITALESVDITQRSSGERTFFDVASVGAVSYGSFVGWAIVAVALSLGIIAWVKVTAVAIRAEGVLRWLLTIIWIGLGSAAVVLSMVGATWALRAARQVYHPWYAYPHRMFLLMVAVGITVAWGCARLGRWLPQRAHGFRNPNVVWSAALPLWIAIASGSLWVAPGAAYLWLLPLLTAGLLLTVIPSSATFAVRAASLVVLVVAATLWLRDTIDLLAFMVAVLGRLPIVTPVFVYAVLLAMAGLMMAPPLLATIVGSRPLLRPSLVTAVCLTAIAVTAGFAYVAPAYTYEHPLRRYARVVQERDRPAAWEVGSLEPGLDLAEGAPKGWTPAPRQSPSLVSSVPMPRSPYPFVYRASAGDLGPAPIDITFVRLEPVTEGVQLTLTVVPRQPGLAISLILPEQVHPARSNLPGVQRYGRWTATYVAPPPEGVEFQASFGPGMFDLPREPGANPLASERFKQVIVAVTAQASSSGPGWVLPSWLPQERTVWTADATWLVAPSQMPIAPVPPLR